MLKKKLTNCPKCGEKSFIWIETNNSQEKSEEIKEFQHLIKKLESIWKSSKSAYEKKIELFEVLEKIDFGELSKTENERLNYLLQSRLYSELAKKALKKYKQSTIKDFNKKK